MLLSSTRFLIFVGILLVVLFCESESKRGGGGGRRGSVSRGSTSVWGRSKQSQSHDLRNNQRKKSQQTEGDLGTNPDTPDAGKPSAPPAPGKKDASKPSVGAVEQDKKQSMSAPEHSQPNPGNAQQRPIGWDVGPGPKPDAAGNKNVGWNVGSNNNPQPSTGNIGQPPPPYPGKNTYPAVGAGNNYNGQSHNQAQLNNQQVPGQYGAPNTGYGAPNAGYGAPNAGYGSPNSGYGGPNLGYGAPNTGYMAQHGPYHANMNGYGNAPMGGGFYGGNAYNSRGYGGFGGYNGYGGYGGHGMGGYGQKFGGGFGMGFGQHAVRNVVVGLLVWNLISGLTRRPYYVYNYHNNPEKVPEEIPLPANTIVLCPENVTALCAPNTAALCTSSSTIMCVVLAQNTVPCDGNSTLKCASSTVSCTDGDETLCNTKNTTITPVNIPCITNATVIGKIQGGPSAAFSPGGSTSNTTELCVTTLAIPQPEEDQKLNDPTLCKPNDPTQLENTNITACVNNTQASQNLTTPSSVTTTTDLKHTSPKQSSK